MPARAKSPSRRAYFRNAQRRPLGHFGRRSSVTISSGRRSVESGPVKKSPARARSGRAADGDFALASPRDAGQLGGRVGMGKATPDRATVADLVVCDVRDNRVKQRMPRHQPLIVLNVAPAYERAEA